MIPSLAQLGIKSYAQLVADFTKKLEPIAVWENTMEITTWWGLKSKFYVITALARTEEEAKEKMENYEFHTIEEM